MELMKFDHTARRKVRRVVGQVSSTLLDSEGSLAQGKALLRGFEIAKDFDRLKADGMAAITALLDRPIPLRTTNAPHP